MKMKIACAFVIGAVASSTIAGEVFYQGFEGGTDGWYDSNTDWYGGVTRVTSGTDGVASASGSYHAVFTQSSDTGAFTRFDGFRDNWPGAYQARASVYLDTNWNAGEGFSYSVASNTTSGDHLRDFIFHVAMDESTGQLLVGASNNTDFDPPTNLENSNHAVITTSGWYTFEHSFFEMEDGSLGVAMNLYDSGGALIFTEILNNASDLIGINAGGNRYGWFTNIDVAGGIHVDDTMLSVVPLPPAAFAGLGMLAGCAGVRRLRRLRQR